MNVIKHPKSDEAIVRQMMRKICAGLPAKQVKHFTAGALAMLYMGSSIPNINKVARYTVGKAEIEAVQEVSHGG